MEIQRQEIKKRLPGLGRGNNNELLFNEDTVSVWYNEKVLEIDHGDDCTSVYVLNSTELYI